MLAILTNWSKNGQWPAVVLHSGLWYVVACATLEWKHFVPGSNLFVRRLCSVFHVLRKCSNDLLHNK